MDKRLQKTGFPLKKAKNGATYTEKKYQIKEILKIP